MNSLTQPVFSALFCGKDSTIASKTIGSVLHITSNVATAVTVAKALGFPISFGSAFAVGVAPALIVGATVAGILAALKLATTVNTVKHIF